MSDDEATPRKKRTAPSLGSSNVSNAVFDKYLAKLMEANGWVMQFKPRPLDAGVPGHIDMMFFPPGVTRGHPFKQRVDYWDSRSQLIKALRENAKFQNDVLVKFVIQFYDCVLEVSKKESIRIKKQKIKVGFDQVEDYYKAIIRQVNMPLPDGIAKPDELVNIWNGASSSTVSSTNNSANLAFIPTREPWQQLHELVNERKETKRKKSSDSDAKSTRYKKKKEKSESENNEGDNVIQKRTPDAAAVNSVDLNRNSYKTNKTTATRHYESSHEDEQSLLQKIENNLNKHVAESRKTPTVTSVESAERQVFENTNLKKPTATDLPGEKKIRDKDASTGVKVAQPQRPVVSEAREQSLLNDIQRDIQRQKKVDQAPAASKTTKKDIIATATVPRKTASCMNDAVPRKNKPMGVADLLLVASIPSSSAPQGVHSITKTVDATSKKVSKKHLVANRASAREDTPADQVESSYYNFQQKFQPVREIEFKGLHGQSVNKSIWNQHKSLYGNSCSDTCQCPSDLRRLCENVLSDVRKSLADKGEDVPPVTLAGFVTCFAPRFYGKVAEEFPSDSPAEILSKMLQMWERHKKEKYGGSCSAFCTCRDGWDNIFLAKCLRLSPGKMGHRSSANSETASSSSSMPDNAQAERTEYSITFDPSLPLGIYTTTSTGNLTSECKVVSINPYQADMDARLSKGTTVVATEIGGVREDVTSHLELKNRYHTARKSNQKLTLWFINTHVSAPNTEAQKRQWSSNGIWQGKLFDEGWAGGAESLTKTAGNAFEQREVSSKREGSLLGQSLKEADMLKWSVQPCSAQRPRPLMSALRHHGEKKTERVSFGEKQNTLKYFRRNDFELASSNNVALGNYTDLTYTVVHGDVQELLNVLIRSGTDVETSDMNDRTALEYAAYKYTELEQLMLSSTGIRDASLEYQKLMYDLKKKLLKFFIEANSVIYASEALYYWSYATISISGFKDLSPLDFSAHMPTCDKVYCTVRIRRRPARSLPCVPLSSSPSWSDLQLLTFQCEYHKHSYKENEVVVDLYTGENLPAVDNIVLLGSWFGDIDDCVDRSKDQTDIVTKISRKTGYVQEGDMSWKIEKLKFDEKVAESTRENLARRLFTLIDWLENLKRDAAGVGMSIDANVTFPLHGNLTLLHAAVYLQDRKLVRRLLQLGANPNFCGCMEGTPVELSSRRCFMSESVRMEIHNLLTNAPRN